MPNHYLAVFTLQHDDGDDNPCERTLVLELKSKTMSEAHDTMARHFEGHKKRRVTAAVIYGYSEVSHVVVDAIYYLLDAEDEAKRTSDIEFLERQQLAKLKAKYE